jgi:tRNA/rRNA methyltransferase
MLWVSFFSRLMTMMALRVVTTRFILVQTSHNVNVGAAARAIKTMGFDDLCLVQPRDPKVLNRSKTIHGASGALDVLGNTKTYDTVEEALEGFDYKCATGMPVSMAQERAEQIYVPPRQYFNEIIIRGDSNQASLKIAFLFGNENCGLKQHEIAPCSCVLGIPTNPNFGSLNLAAAVQLIAYDWREALGGFR